MLAFPVLVVDATRSTPSGLTCVATESLTPMPGACLVLLVTLLALVCEGFESGPDCSAVFDVPGPPLGRPVPLRCQRADPLQVGVHLVGAGPSPTPGMASRVVFDRKAVEVAGFVIERVPVLVVNVTCGGYRPAVVGHPYFLVETANPIDPIAASGSVVGALRPAFRVRVSTECDALKDDAVDSIRHDNRVSPYRSSSRRVQPFPSTHTGWFPVPVIEHPWETSTRYTAAEALVMPEARTG